MSKEEVLARLPPCVRRGCDEFAMCRVCDQVYRSTPGSSGGEQVVHDQCPVPGDDGVQVYLKAIRAIL